MKKLSTVAKYLSLALAVIFWVYLLYSIFYGFFSLRSCIALLGESAENSIVSINGITQNHLSIYSETGIEISRQSFLINQLLSLFVYLVRSPVLCYGIHLLRKILLPIQQQRPFSGTSSVLLRLGCVSILLAVIQNLYELGLTWIYEQNINISRLFQGGIITEVHFQYEPDITYILLAAVVFILSTVFRYGEELQQLSDETL